MHTQPPHQQAGKVTDILCSVSITSMSLGSCTDLNMTHACGFLSRWSFSDWPGLWLEGSHRRVGKLDRRWGASDRRWERKGEAVALVTEGELLSLGSFFWSHCGNQSSQDMWDGVAGSGSLPSRWHCCSKQYCKNELFLLQLSLLNTWVLAGLESTANTSLHTIPGGSDLFI